MKIILRSLTVLIVSFVLTSCYDGGLELTALSPDYKTEILEYFREVERNANEENKLRIESLTNAINFSCIELKALKFGHEILIAELFSKGESIKMSKLVLFKINQRIERAYILDFTEFSNLFSITNDLIVKFFNNESHRYSGKYEIKNIYNNLIFFCVFDYGNLKENGLAVKKRSDSKSSSGRVSSCIDWYLITRYYENGALIWQGEQYIGTTCDCEQNSTRSTGVQCNGGDGGGSGGLPQNPVPGQQFTVSNPQGVYKVLEYHCYDYGCLWEVIYTILDEVVVQSDRIPYYFLPMDPLPNQIILGPDGFFYIYNSNSGQWIGEIQSKNILCGGYTFTSTGEGLTAEILNLGASAKNASNTHLLLASWGTMCITFGSSSIVNNSVVGSQVFNQAWNQTMNEIQTWLNTQLYPTNIQFTNYILLRLRYNLELYAQGYAVLSTGPCAGNIASSVASYDCD